MINQSQPTKKSIMINTSISVNVVVVVAAVATAICACKEIEHSLIFSRCGTTFP